MPIEVGLYKRCFYTQFNARIPWIDSKSLTFTILKTNLVSLSHNFIMRFVHFVALLATANAIPNERRANVEALVSRDPLAERSVAPDQIVAKLHSVTNLSVDLATTIKSSKAKLGPAKFAPVERGFKKIITGVKVGEVLRPLEASQLKPH